VRLNVTTAAAGLALDLQDVKTHLRIDNDSDGTSVDDAFLVGTAIPAVSAYVERMCGRAFLTQTWTYKLDRFPWDSVRIEIPKPPLQSITSVTYLDGNGDSQTVSASDYNVITSTDVAPGIVELDFGKSWPTTRTQVNAVTITFVAGYGASPEDVPAELKLAMLAAIGVVYEHREPVTLGMKTTDVVLAGADNMMWAMMGDFRQRRF